MASAGEKWAQKKNPFFTGKAILPQQTDKVNHFFLYFCSLFRYNGSEKRREVELLRQEIIQRLSAAAEKLVGGGKVDSVLYLSSKGEATRAQLAVIFLHYVQNAAEAK